MRKAVYPGSFDPITRGHMDLIARGSRLFDELIVAVGQNPAKEPLFPPAERLEMVRAAAEGLDNVRVDSFDGLVVDYAKSQDARIIFRGVRTASDFEYELQMAFTNRTFGGDIETVFVMSSSEFAHLNSRLIKQVAAMGGDVSAFVTPEVAQRLRERLTTDNEKLTTDN